LKASSVKVVPSLTRHLDFALLSDGGI